jgi:hypothetical protein
VLEDGPVPIPEADVMESQKAQEGPLSLPSRL